MPVPRRLWHPIFVSMPAYRARRSIILYTSRCPMRRSVSLPFLLIDRPEEGRSLFVANAGGIHKIGFEIMIARHLDDLSILFVETEPKMSFLNITVFDVEAGGRAYAPKRIQLGGDQSAIAEADDRGHIDRIEKQPCFGRGEDRGFSLAHCVLRPPDRRCRIGTDNSTDYEPIKKHANGGKLLLDRGLIDFFAALFDVGGDVEGLNGRKFASPVMVAPSEETDAGSQIRSARIGVADAACEELEESARGIAAGADDHCWQALQAGTCQVVLRRQRS